MGSVNAKRTHFELSVQDMALAEALYPGWLEGLLTRPVQELDNYEEMIRLLIEEREAIRFLSRAVAGCQDSSKPHPLVSELGLPVDDQGRILVDTYLLVRGTSGAWTAGDCAAVPES